MDSKNEVLAGDLLFVYGTLRQQKNIHALLCGKCDFLGLAIMQGTLYEVNHYPAAILSNTKNDKVIGELYRVNFPSQLIPSLDDYEECSDKFEPPHEYTRQLIHVTFQNTPVKAWVYLYNWSVLNLKQITSGDYLKRD